MDFYDIMLSQKLSGGGGGASNVVRGEFLTSKWNETIDIPYDGNGFPVFAGFWVKGGLHNNNGQAVWNNAKQANIIGGWCMIKNNMESPTWENSDADKAMIFSAVRYNSSNDAMISKYSDNSVVFKKGKATDGTLAMVNFVSDKQIETLSSPYSGLWFLQGVTYEYVIVYSE